MVSQSFTKFQPNRVKDICDILKIPFFKLQRPTKQFRAYNHKKNLAKDPLKFRSVGNTLQFQNNSFPANYYLRKKY